MIAPHDLYMHHHTPPFRAPARSSLAGSLRGQHYIYPHRRIYSPIFIYTHISEIGILELTAVVVVVVVVACVFHPGKSRLEEVCAAPGGVRRIARLEQCYVCADRDGNYIYADGTAAGYSIIVPPRRVNDQYPVSPRTASHI